MNLLEERKHLPHPPLSFPRFSLSIYLSLSPPRFPAGTLCLFNLASPWLPVCHVEVMSLIINFIVLQPRCTQRTEYDILHRPLLETLKGAMSEGVKPQQ